MSPKHINKPIDKKKKEEKEKFIDSGFVCHFQIAVDGKIAICIDNFSMLIDELLSMQIASISPSTGVVLVVFRFFFVRECTIF